MFFSVYLKCFLHLIFLSDAAQHFQSWHLHLGTFCCSTESWHPPEFHLGAGDQAPRHSHQTHGTESVLGDEAQTTTMINPYCYLIHPPTVHSSIFSMIEWVSFTPCCYLTIATTKKCIFIKSFAVISLLLEGMGRLTHL